MKTHHAKTSHITQVTVERRDDPLQALGRAERDLIRRHQAAMKQLDRWDVARELRPHTPKLVNEILRRDDAIDWEAPVIQAMAHQAGPRTGTHPMATRLPQEPPKPMATRLRPPLADFEEPAPGKIPESLAGAATVILILSAVLMAVALAGT